MARALEFISNHWMMFSGLLIVTVLLIQDLFDSLTRKHKLLTPAGLVALLNAEDEAIIIDVRELPEFNDGHITNARHIPLAKVSERLGEIDQNAPIIVTCQQGTRSPAACNTLTRNGYKRVYEMRGGMLAWNDANMPITKKRK